MRLRAFTVLMCLAGITISGCAATAISGEPAEKMENDKAKAFDLGEGVLLEMVFLEGGSFMMGSPETEKGRLDRAELDVRREIVSNFWIGKFEITQAQYRAIAGSEHHFFFSGAQKPAHEVRWKEAIEFCSRLSERTGWDFNLPTEAQWEYACRAASATRFSFGDDETLLGEYAWYAKNASKWSELGEPQDVGRKKPNKFGLYDMHGNIWEWCLDRYVDDLFRKRDENPEDRDYFEREGLIPRVIKGGGWHSGAVACRCATRFHQYERQADIKVGFRVVATPRGAAKKDP